MTQDIDIVIPTVLPQRSVELAALLSQLHGRSVRVEVHEPGAPPWARVERIFGRARGEWLVQLEDDVTLAPGAIDRIVEVVSTTHARRRALYSFFSRWSIEPDPDAVGPSIVGSWPYGRFHMTQAIAMRSVDAGSFARWFPPWKAEHPEVKSGLGRALGAWAKWARVDICVHFPSLVQHLPVASTISRRPRNRQSPTFRSTAP